MMTFTTTMTNSPWLRALSGIRWIGHRVTGVFNESWDVYTGIARTKNSGCTFISSTVHLNCRARTLSISIKTFCRLFEYCKQKRLIIGTARFEKSDKFARNSQSICAPSYLQVTAPENHTDPDTEPDRATYLQWPEAEFPPQVDWQ